MSEQNTIETTAQTAEQTAEQTAAPIVKAKRVMLPAFDGQSAAKVPTFKVYIESQGHTMEAFKAEGGKELRKALNAEYEVMKAQFSAGCTGKLMEAIASGQYTVTKATRNKSGHITPVLVPVKENKAEQQALALLQSKGYKVSK